MRLWIIGAEGPTILNLQNNAHAHSGVQGSTAMHEIVSVNTDKLYQDPYTSTGMVL